MLAAQALRAPGGSAVCTAFVATARSSRDCCREKWASTAENVPNATRHMIRYSRLPVVITLSVKSSCELCILRHAEPDIDLGQISDR